MFRQIPGLSPKMRRGAMLVAPLLVAFGSVAQADTPIHQVRDAAPDARIVIHNVKGEVRVTGWNQDRVQVDGTLGSGAKPLQIDGDAHALDIRVESANKSGWFGLGGDDEMNPTELDVHVPHAASLEVHVVSAPVAVDGVDGARLGVHTVSGRVHLGVRAGAVTVGSVSGDVDLTGSARDFVVETVSGDVQAATVGESATAQTVSGDVLMHGGALRRLGLGTVSGKLQLDAAIAPEASWKVDSMSGDVRIGLPADASARIKADTFSGDLHTDFARPVSSEHGPGQHLNATLGNGSATITVNSFSGDVRIERGSH